MITFEGLPQLQTRLKALVLEFINVFATKERRAPAAVETMKIVIDKDKWRLPCNRAPPRKHSEEKQKEIRKQVDALMKLGVIKESQATNGVKSIWYLSPHLKENLRSGDSLSTSFD
jgi:hypothetical protein